MGHFVGGSQEEREEQRTQEVEMRMIQSVVLVGEGEFFQSDRSMHEYIRERS